MNENKKTFLASAVSGFLMTAAALAQSVNVEVNLNVRHEVGGISTFDRSKFVTIHSNHTDGDWNGGQNGDPNFTNDLLAATVLENDIYFGRDTGYISGQLKNTVNEDPAKPGWAVVSNNIWSIEHQGAYQRGRYADKTSLHSYENRLDG